MKTPFSQTTSDPTLTHLLALVKKDIQFEINCHAIGIVQSFDKNTQTVQAIVAYYQSYFELNPDGKTYSANLVDYPILVDCPVIILGGGKGSLTFPIAKGDECLLMFNDRDIDNWFKSGQKVAPNTTRLHSFSDALAIIGPRSKARLLTDYDATRAVLQYGTTVVAVGDSLVKIANATTTLNTLLQNLITEIKGLSTTNAVVGSPCTLSPATITALATVATNLGALLE